MKWRSLCLLPRWRQLCLLRWWRGKGSQERPGASFIKALIPLVRTPRSWPKGLPKIPPPAPLPMVCCVHRIVEAYQGSHYIILSLVSAWILGGHRHLVHGVFQPGELIPAPGSGSELSLRRPHQPPTLEILQHFMAAGGGCAGQPGRGASTGSSHSGMADVKTIWQRHRNRTCLVSHVMR